jgi:hypothetical protein
MQDLEGLQRLPGHPPPPLKYTSPLACRRPEKSRGRPRGCSGLGFRRRSGFGGYVWKNLCFPCTYDLTKAKETH